MGTHRRDIILKPHPDIFKLSYAELALFEHMGISDARFAHKYQNPSQLGTGNLRQARLHAAMEARANSESAGSSSAADSRTPEGVVVEA